MIGFELSWFAKDKDECLGSMDLDITIEEVRGLFGFNDTEYTGDCMSVGDEQAAWLRSKGVSIDDAYDYDICIFSS